MGYNFALLEIKAILATLARGYDWSLDLEEGFSPTSALPTLGNGMPMKCWKLAEPMQGQISTGHQVLETC